MIHQGTHDRPSEGKALRNMRRGGFRITVLDNRVTEELIEQCCPTRQQVPADFEQLEGSELSMVHRFDHGGNVLVRKIFFNRSPFEPVKDFFRGSRANRSARGDSLLRSNGFNAPRCLLVGKGEAISFCVNEFVPNATDLLLLARQAIGTFQNSESVLSKPKIVSTLGKIIGKMHAKNISHGDLRLKNILLQNFHPPGNITVWFLDNERTRQYKNLPHKARVKNLVQINMIPPNAATDWDRGRFFHEYLKQNPQCFPKRQELIQAVARITASRMEKYR